MSLKIEGKKCPICHGYLFEEDEIVWCPECGAPHHKDCFKSLGKCGYSELHGTKELEDILNSDEEKAEKHEAKPESSEIKDSNVTSEQKENCKNEVVNTSNEVKKTDGAEGKNDEFKTKINVRCNSCGALYPADYEKCPNCSAENTSKVKSAYVFDLLGGVSPKEDIGEGVSAEKAAAFVSISTNRFLPKFKAFKKGKKSFFSIWSFFFPTANLAARKMYKYAFLSGIIEVAAILFLFPLNNAMGSFGFQNREEIIAYLQSEAGNELLPLIILALAGVGLMLALKLVMAFCYDRIYYKHTISKVKEIEENCEDDSEKFMQYRTKGGLNPFSFLLTIMILQFVPSFILSFIF